MKCSACDGKGGDLLRRPDLGDGGFYCLPCLKELFPTLEGHIKKAKEAYRWRLKDQEREQLERTDKLIAAREQRYRKSIRQIF